MKALSIRQPWAWLVINGPKDIENRTWSAPANVIGTRIYIHASKTFDEEGYLWVKRHFPAVVLPTRPAFDRGGIVGSAVLTQCVTRSDSPWFCGPFGFVFAAPLKCLFRPCRGMLGFFEAQ